MRRARWDITEWNGYRDLDRHLDRDDDGDRGREYDGNDDRG
jgi:hypothetical protein